MNKNIKKILVIRFSSLGDLILMSPLFRAMRKTFFNASIDFLTSNEFQEIYQDSPFIDKQILINRKKKSKEKQPENVQNLNLSQYDLIFDAHCSIRSKKILFKHFGLYYFTTSKIIKIKKYNFNKIKLIYKLKRNKKQLTYLSQREKYLEMLQQFSCVPHQFDTTTELYMSCINEKRLNSLFFSKIDSKKPTIAIGTSASFELKKWPKEYHLKVIQTIQHQFNIVLLNGRNEDREARWITKQLDKNHNIINLSGQCNISETLMILKNARLCLSNDSALTHMSESVHCPVFTFFGPTVKEFGFAPFLNQSKILDAPLSCRPCSKTGSGQCHNIKKMECMYLISPQKTIEAIKRFFKE